MTSLMACGGDDDADAPGGAAPGATAGAAGSKAAGASGAGASSGGGGKAMTAGGAGAGGAGAAGAAGGAGGSGGAAGGATGGASQGGSSQGGSVQGGSSQGGAGQGGSSQGGAGQGGAGQGAAAGAPVGSRGPAYDAGNASCPAEDGVRRIKLVNNCAEPRWFKLDGRTTPLWARPGGCPWEGEPCGDVDGVGECTARAKQLSPDVDPGLVYCKQREGQGPACACNPFFELSPGEQHTIELPAGAPFASGTGWLATGCNPLGAACSLGNEPAHNAVFELTYDGPGGSLYYDISAVNAFTSASPVGMKSCGVAADPADVFWCRGTGCRFDVATQCPDGSDAFAPAPPGCVDCPTADVGGKLVIVGSCGSCPDGASGNRVATGVVFNANNVGGPEWTWQGDPAFASSFGYDEGAHANRLFGCGPAGCAPAAAQAADTCMGGCDLCTLTRGVAPDHPDCIKYCCPDVTVTYGGASYRYDSAGCTALGVQAGTDYTVAVKGACPYVYTFGYEDHSSTFRCSTDASLLVQACPDPVDFPSVITP